MDIRDYSIRPSWYGIHFSDERLRAADFDTLKKEAEELDAYNQKVFCERQAAFIKLLEQIKLLFGEKSNFLAYARKQAIWRPGVYGYGLEEQMARKDKLLKADAERKAVQDKIQKENDYLQEAISFLEARGKKIGIDYVLILAADAATKIRFEEEKAKAIASNEWFEFNGDDNCENCLGWDGKEHRCQCGNRRVDWSYEGDFKSMYIYGEAY